jgi:hypothetical protein
MGCPFWSDGHFFLNAKPRPRSSIAPRTTPLACRRSPARGRGAARGITACGRFRTPSLPCAEKRAGLSRPRRPEERLIPLVHRDPVAIRICDGERSAERPIVRFDEDRHSVGNRFLVERLRIARPPP